MDAEFEFLSRCARLPRVTSPVFSSTDPPKVILDLAGRWLASNMPEFRWLKSRQDLERKSRLQTHRVHLQSSTWSRTGIATWVSPRLTVLDDRLRAWRQRHPTGTVATNPDSALPMVFNSLFINFLKPWSSVELSGSQPAGSKSVDVSELLDCLVNNVLPVLDQFAEPVSLASALPPEWWSMIDAGAVEWALACSDRGSATAFVRGHMERPLRGQQTAGQRLSSFRDGWERRRRGDDPDSLPMSLVALGWLSAAHELVEPEALQPAV